MTGALFYPSISNFTEVHNVNVFATWVMVTSQLTETRVRSSTLKKKKKKKTPETD